MHNDEVNSVAQSTFLTVTPMSWGIFFNAARYYLVTERRLAQHMVKMLRNQMSVGLICKNVVIHVVWCCNIFYSLIANY
jgi:hypothetical protein